MEKSGVKVILLLALMIGFGNCSEDVSYSTNSTESHGIHIFVWNWSHIKTMLIFTIVVILAGSSKLVFHHANFLSSKVPESCMLILVGTVLGAIIHFTDAGASIPNFFEPDQFFMYLLPPIILESAFSLHDRTFAENLGSILLFAVVGTILACFMLGGSLYGLAQSGAMGSIEDISLIQMLVFTSLIVAVDPVAVLAVFQEIGVNHVLYFLVFGESLLNDGVTIVLYNVMQSYNLMDSISVGQIALGILKFFVVCFGGLFVGVVFGLFSALFTRLSTQVKVVQPIIIYGMAYSGFLIAELFEFSGIISIIGCGLVQVHYSFKNISDKSKLAIKYFTKVFSTFSEILIFLFLGLSFVRQGLVWHSGFILWTLLLCLVYRFIITFGMTFLINKFDTYRVRKIGLDEQFMIAYGGLRGAVCFSLVALLNPKHIPQKDLFLTATLAVIVFTGFVQGITIKPLVSFLKIRLAPEKNEIMYLELNEHITDHMMAGIEDVLGFHGKYYLKEKVEHIDDKYLKKIFLVKPMKKSDSALMCFYEKIMLKEHIKYLKLCGVKSLPKSIPKIDTQLYLSEVEDGRTTDSSDLKHQSYYGDDDGGIVMRRNLDSSPMDAHDLRSLLKSMHTSRFLIHSMNDKNLISDPRQSCQSVLRDKTHKNRSLQRVMSMSDDRNQLERCTSWNEDQADICNERIKHTQNAPAAVRSTSVDDSKISTGSRVHFESPSRSAVTSLTTVDEMPDQNSEITDIIDGNGTAELTPLLSQKTPDNNKRDHLIERQDAMDEIPMVIFT